MKNELKELLKKLHEDIADFKLDELESDLGEILFRNGNLKIVSIGCLFETLKELNLEINPENYLPNNCSECSTPIPKGEKTCSNEGWNDNWDRQESEAIDQEIKSINEESEKDWEVETHNLKHDDFEKPKDDL